MESNSEKQLKVCEERKYMHCITDGIRQAWNNIGNLLQYAWPALLICAVLAALTGFVLVKVESEGSTPNLIAMAVLIVLSVLGSLLYMGTMDAMLVRWRDLDYEPVVTMKSLRSLILQRMKRDCSLLILWFLVFMLSFVITYGIGVFQLPLWVVGVTMFVLLLLIVPADMIVMEVRYSDNPIAQCFGKYIQGWRYYGRILAFNLVVVILMLLVSIVAMLPMIVIDMVNLEVAEATAMGDMVNLPAHYWLLVALAYAICSVLMLIALFVWSHAHCLLWGSITENEQKRLQAQEADNVETTA